MQIFRPFESHKTSAQYLDNARLNKQVVEAYQIIRTILAHEGIIEAGNKYINHPIVKFIYNNGDPYLYDLYQYLLCCNKEFIARGGNRSQDFQDKIDGLYNYVKEYVIINMPPYYRYGSDEIYDETAFEKYQTLIKQKWAKDKNPPRFKFTKEF